MSTQKPSKPKPNRGRPLPTMAANVLPEQLRQMDELAERRFTTRSALVREALAFYLAANMHFLHSDKSHVPEATVEAA